MLRVPVFLGLRWWGLRLLNSESDRTGRRCGKSVQRRLSEAGSCLRFPANVVVVDLHSTCPLHHLALTLPPPVHDTMRKMALSHVQSVVRGGHMIYANHHHNHGVSIIEHNIALDALRDFPYNNALSDNNWWWQRNQLFVSATLRSHSAFQCYSTS